MPTSGTVKVLALLISFTDYPPNAANTSASIASKLFGNGDDAEVPYESLRNYYLAPPTTSSTSRATCSDGTPPAYAEQRSPKPTRARGPHQGGPDTYNGQGHDFSQYDNDGDGRSTTSSSSGRAPHGAWASFWWGYQTGFSDGHGLRLDGKTLGAYSWQWES